MQASAKSSGILDDVAICYRDVSAFSSVFPSLPLQAVSPLAASTPRTNPLARFTTHPTQTSPRNLCIAGALDVLPGGLFSPQPGHVQPGKPHPHRIFPKSVPRNRPRKVLGPGSNNPALQGGRKAQIQARDGPNKQEVLSRYLDLVEVALLKQIWLKSTAFFRALDDIKGLQSLVAVASAKLCTLRTSLRAADEGIALSAMKIPQLYRRRTNEKALCSLLQHTQQVLQGKMAIEELLGLEDYVGALQVVSATRSIYSEHLAALAALRAIGSQLEEYSGMICDVMCNKFVNACVSWDVDESVDLHGLSDASNGSYLDSSVCPMIRPFLSSTD
jgi:Vacuolar-sorting protein 54, of GARP complex